MGFYHKAGQGSRRAFSPTVSRAGCCLKGPLLGHVIRRSLRGPQIFQKSRSRLKSLGPRRMTRSKVHTEQTKLHGAGSFLSSYQPLIKSRNSPHFTQPDGSNEQSAQSPAICPFLCQFSPVHRTISWIYILTLSSHLRLYAPFLFAIRVIRPAHLILLNFFTRTTLGEEYRALSSSWRSLLHSLVISSLLCPSLPQHPILEHPPPIFPCWRPTNILSGASFKYFVVQDAWRPRFVHPCSRHWK